MITIIDYGLGNLASIANALTKLGIPYQITGSLSEINRASALILPGVGAAGQGMDNLRKSGIETVLIEKINCGTPLLGICLGMQLLFTSSEEGNVACLNILPGNIKKFREKEKVPQVGWNTVAYPSRSSLFTGIKRNSYFYFVNSYYCEPRDAHISIGMTEYGKAFSSAVSVNNIYGVQFHPEKSGDAGLKVLQNFTEVLC